MSHLKDMDLHRELCRLVGVPDPVTGEMPEDYQDAFYEDFECEEDEHCEH